MITACAKCGRQTSSNICPNCNFTETMKVQNREELHFRQTMR